MTTKESRPKRPRKRAAEPAPEPVAEPAAEAAGSSEPVASEDQERDIPGWDGSATRLVVFGMAGQRYALPIDAVQEIQQLVAISEMPSASGAVIGAINLRGQVVPAIDLRLLIGVPVCEYALETPMILARTSHGLVALIVDDVEDVVLAGGDSLQEPSAVYELAEKMLSVCRLETGLVFVLDIDALVVPVAHAVGAMTP